MNAEHFHELGGSYRVSVTNTSTQQALHHVAVVFVFNVHTAT